MIPLPFLWKWLWVNFSPLDHDKTSPEGFTPSSPSPQQDESQAKPSPVQSAASSSSSGNGNGIRKDAIVQELLSTKEVNKANNVQATVFAKALIGRYLCVLFQDSVHCRTRFSDSNDPVNYTVRRTTAAEREKRLKTVPDFPQDLRTKILQELKEERLGRTSARNLLQLMTQPSSTSSSSSSTSSSSKKPRLETSVSTPQLLSHRSGGGDRLSPSVSPLPSSPVATITSTTTTSPLLLQQLHRQQQQQQQHDGMDLVVEAAEAAATDDNVLNPLHHRLRKRRRSEVSVEDDNAALASTALSSNSSQRSGDGGEEAAAATVAEQPASKRPSLRRSLSLSGSGVSQPTSSPLGSPMRKAVTTTSTSSTMVTSSEASSNGAAGLNGTNAAAVAMSGMAAMGRMLRRQVSTPVLPTQIGQRAVGVPGSNGPATAGGGVAQEPWKREVNDLWAKQLAMLREINTLKNELGRREAARQREILGLRQEIDGLRGEVLRLRQMKGGLVPLQKPVEAVEAGAAETAPPSSTTLLAAAETKPISPPTPPAITSQPLVATSREKDVDASAHGCSG